MKYKECDIVFIKPIKKEGMVISTGKDLETGIEKYFVHVENQFSVICKEDQLEYVTTMEERIEEVVSVFDPVVKA